MPTDEFTAHRKGPSAHLKEIGWEAYYGTTYSGNLPQYKPDPNPCDVDIDNVTMEGVTLSDFHYYHKECPYSNEASLHFVVNMDPNSSNYGGFEEVMPANRSNHNATKGIMIRYGRGSKYGHLCADDNCYYYTTIISGTRFFCL